MRCGLALALAATACVRAPAAPEAPVGECTRDTPLVEGVPGSPGHLISSELHPEGASELATLMRTMQGDLKQAREALSAGGRAAPMLARHRRIRCAWPTSPSDRAGAFDELAAGYLRRVQALDEAPADATAYGAVLGGCRACHETTCPGPLAAIEALAL